MPDPTDSLVDIVEEMIDKLDENNVEVVTYHLKDITRDDGSKYAGRLQLARTDVPGESFVDYLRRCGVF